MKLVKTQICLYIFEQLMLYGFIDIALIKNKFNVNDKTFSRYINEIKKYFSEFYPNKKLVYIRSSRQYQLVK